MYHLATVFPFIRKLRFPFLRSPIMLLMLAFNELLLGFETYSAHIIRGTIIPQEWIPIIFGPIAGALLLIAGMISFRKRDRAVILANLVFLASIVVGLLGAYFHLRRAILPFAPLGEQISVPLLVWAPPSLAPLTFALIGLIGISTLWIEDPPDSGVLVLWQGKRITMPYSKTRAFFFMVGLGNLSTVISSVLDHSRAGFDNALLWIPTAVGIFGVVVALVLGFIREPSRSDLITYMGAMVLMALTGMMGSYLHIRQDLTAQGTVVIERLIRGAPVMAPMLFADMGAIGLIALLDPREKIEPRS
jgi:hypothetical protein